MYEKTFEFIDLSDNPLPVADEYYFVIVKFYNKITKVTYYHYHEAYLNEDDMDWYFTSDATCEDDTRVSYFGGEVLGYAVKKDFYHNPF